MSNLRVVVAYHNNPRTTAHYIVNALRQYGADVLAAGPGHELSFSRRGFPKNNALDLEGLWEHLTSESLEPDLFLCVDSGGTLFLPGLRSLPIPIAYYSIDGHRFPRSTLAVGAQFDVTFVAQLPLMRALSSRGISVEWLPLAADLDVFAPSEDSHQVYDFVFVGNPYSHSASPTYRFVGAMRRQVLTSLTSEYNGLVTQAAPRDTPREYARGLVGMNVAGGDRSLDINMRAFEIPACRAPLLTNGDWQSLRRLFVLGKDIAYFSTLDECRIILRRLLMSRSLREDLAYAGYERVVERHTYMHRAERILNRLEGIRPGKRARLLPSARVKWWQSGIGVRLQSPVLGQTGNPAPW